MLKDGGVASVDAALCGVARCLQGYACDVLHAYYRAVGVGAYHDILKLLYGREASAGHYGDCHVDIIDGGLPEDSGCRLAVLVLKGVLEVLDRQPHVGQLVGPPPISAWHNSGCQRC